MGPRPREPREPRGARPPDRRDDPAIVQTNQREGRAKGFPRTLHIPTPKRGAEFYLRASRRYLDSADSKSANRGQVCFREGLQGRWKGGSRTRRATHASRPSDHGNTTLLIRL